jgi:hypothetical protein
LYRKTPSVSSVFATWPPADGEPQWSGPVRTHDDADAAVGVESGGGYATVGADKAYDEAGFIAALCGMKISPHINQYKGWLRHIARRTTRHPGYDISRKKRKSIEQIIGWIKNTALMCEVRHRGPAPAQWQFALALSAYNMVRMRNPAAAAA